MAIIKNVVLLLLCLLISGSFAGTCVSPDDELIGGLDYCSSFVVWDIQVTDEDVATREERALSNYRRLLKVWNGTVEGTVSNNCLAYGAFIHCVEEFPRCENGEDLPLCKWLCEENKERCADDIRVCDDLPTDACSFGMRVSLSSTAFLMYIVAVGLWSLVFVI